MTPQKAAKPEWPKFATSPKGGRARFDCEGDVPVGWTLEGHKKPLHEPRKETTEEVAAAVAAQPDDELTRLRKRYHDDFGREARPGWDEEDLRKKLGIA